MTAVPSERSVAGSEIPTTKGVFDASTSFFWMVLISMGFLIGSNGATRFDIGRLKKSHDSVPVKLGIAKRFDDSLPSMRNFSASEGRSPLANSVRFVV